MALSIEIPELYPLSFIVVVLYAFFLVWCGVNVMSARKKYGVKLPAAYEAREDSEFNRYQRVHQVRGDGRRAALNPPARPSMLPLGSL
jgi:hypothetical protein